MSGPDEFQGSDAPFTDDELRAVEAEPLPDREAMTTLLWAPAPGAIAPPVDGLIGEEGA